jgi:DNA-binding MarR family transcriptional regulator
MNSNRVSESEQQRALQILSELSNNDSLTQRDLSSRLGIALGLVNSYIKNLVAKGYLTVKAIPPRRYAYFLTPKGFAEKTRLTYDMFQDYTRIYREARGNLQRLFSELDAGGVSQVVLAGADEVAEIAFLTLQETGLELTGIVDEEKAGDIFFGRQIKPISQIRSLEYDRIVVASYLKRDKIYEKLLSSKAEKNNIEMIFK